MSAANDKFGVGNDPNDAGGDSFAAMENVGVMVYVPRRIQQQQHEDEDEEGGGGGGATTSPPASKRRKECRAEEEEGDGVVAGCDPFEKSSPPNNDEAPAASWENLDVKKPAAAVSKSDPGDVVPGESSKRKRHDNNDDEHCRDRDQSLPLAPSLEEYLKGGGHSKYRPRPEWYRFSNDEPDISTAAGLTEALSTGGRFVWSTAAKPSPSVGVGVVGETYAEGRDPADFDIAANYVAETRRDNSDNNNNNNSSSTNNMEAGRSDVIPLAAALDAARAEIRRNNHENHHRRRGHDHDANNRRHQHHHLPFGRGPAPRGGRHPAEAGSPGRGGSRAASAWMNPPANDGRGRGDQLGRVAVGGGFDVDGLAPEIPVWNDPGFARREHQNWEHGLPEGSGRVAPNWVPDHVAGARRGVSLADLGWREPDPRDARRRDHAHMRRRPESPGNPRGGEPSASSSGGGGGGGGEVAVFGFECDSALHLAIKSRATEAAMGLIRLGAAINFPNVKGITPLMIASEEGSLEIVRALLTAGALPNATTVRGSTSLIQACHFGKVSVVEELLRHGAMVDKANLKNTTALMRASQEGHEDVVRLLLSHNAGVNRRNDERMTALMLCSQRGHASIVKMLVKEGAQVDAKTAQDSTSLMLACKRKHLEVAKILVASGTELKLKDCKNRSCLETATRRGNDEFVKILTDDAQVRLMQEASRFARNFSMVRTWKLLQSERATVKLGGGGGAGKGVAIHAIGEDTEPLLRHVCPSKRALVRTMTLPAPLIELISSYLPLPLIWEKRLALLGSRSHVDPDSAIYNALDLIDEVLEVGGIVEAFDASGVNPPSSFASWPAYRSWCGKCDVILSRCADLDVANIFAQESNAVVNIKESNGVSPSNLRPIESSQTQRRNCNYLQVLSRAPPSLVGILSSHPYDMSSCLFAKLSTSHDIQSVVRRLPGGGIHFDTSIANEMLSIARMAVMWAESRPQY